MCVRSDTAKLDIDCMCRDEMLKKPDSDHENRCYAGQYCWKDGQCKSTPK